MILLRIAVKNLIGAGIRTWLNVFVTSISIFMIIFSSGMYTGMMQHAMNVSIKTEIAGGAFWHPNYDPFDPITYEDSHDLTPKSLFEIVEDGNAIEILVSQASIYPQGRFMPVVMKGIPQKQSILQLPTDKFSDYDGDKIPIIIGKGMAEYSQLKEGDIFDVSWSESNGARSALEGEIVHIMDVGNFKIDMGHIWVPLLKVQNMLDMENQSTYVVFKQDFNKISITSDWIKRDVQYLIKDMEAVIEKDRPNAVMIYAILLLLAAMGIFNAQTLSIFRRKKEIGTLMAIGMKKSTVVILFTIEGALNAVFAIALCMILFGPLFYYFGTYGIPLPIDYSDMGLIISKRLMPVYSFPLFLVTSILVFFILLFVSYIPARRISKMNPVDAIRGKVTL